MVPRASFLLIWASFWSIGLTRPTVRPQTSIGANKTTTDYDTISDKILRANKDIPLFLREGDIKEVSDRSALTCSSCFWGKSKQGLVVVPYVFPSDYSDEFKNLITSAMLEYSTITCVRFTPRTKEDNFLNFQNGKGCWSYIGKINGGQTLNLEQGTCMAYGVIQHEMMHSLGFYHEHNRKDRDNYVTINWRYISPEHQKDFEKDNGNTMNMPYDYTSVMHYSSIAFVNTSGKMSIIPKPNPNVAIGQRTGLDGLDVKKINTIYNCNLCRTKLLGPSGTFSSNDATPVVNSNDNCLWLLHVPSYLILLQFSQFTCSSRKCNAMINVYDGVSKDSPLLATVNADQPLPVLVSSGRFILLEYINDTSAPSKFNAFYNSVAYGGTFTTDGGFVESPNYPSHYPSNAQGIYIIIAPPGNQVKLTFSDFDMESSTKCTKDFVVVRDGGSLTSPPLGIYCGKKSNLTIRSRGPMVIILFFSNSEGNKAGFHIDYSFVPLKLKSPRANSED